MTDPDPRADDLSLDIIDAQKEVIRRQQAVDAITDTTEWYFAVACRDRLDAAKRRLARLEPVADWSER